MSVLKTGAVVTALSLLLFLHVEVGFPGGSVVKNPPARAGDVGSIPGLERPPREGNGSPLQYSCLGNPTHRGAWEGYMGLQKSQTQLSI